MKSSILVLCWCVLGCLGAPRLSTEYSAPAIIRSHGYPLEIHSVTTSDGYVLELHRMPHGRAAAAPPKAAVLVNHGLLCASTNWVDLGTNNGTHSFAFQLADAGYDVWLGNMRGNTYSKRHIRLDPASDFEFWDFSYHELGTLDLPSIIDYILKETASESLFYAGHSQGTTMFFVMCSQLPQYCSKVKAMYALAPVAFLKGCQSPPLQWISLFSGPLHNIFDFLGVGEFLNDGGYLQLIGQRFCTSQKPQRSDYCENALFQIAGVNPEQMTHEDVRHLLMTNPNGASNKELTHYAQTIASGEFRQFDYGFIKNRFRYGTWTPPLYNLSRCQVPMELFHSQADWFTASLDLEKLVKRLPRVEKVTECEGFSHLDFLWGRDADRLIYAAVIDSMDRRSAQKN